MNKNIIDILLARDKTVQGLYKSLFDMMKEGWQPYGNVFHDEDDWFCMLMVKYE